LKRYDAIIVGAGYAGLACASQMPGRRLLVLERHNDITKKRRGSLGFLIPFGDQITTSGDNVYIGGMELFVEGGVLQRFNKLEIRGSKERVDFHLRRPLVLLDEEKIKAAILERVKSAGADVIDSAAVREIDFEGKDVKVRTDSEYTGSVLVGADGAHSFVARSLNIKREKLAIMFQREIEVSRMDIPDETLHVQIDDLKNLFFAFPYAKRYMASTIQTVGIREAPDDLERIVIDKSERLGGGRILEARDAVVRLLAPSSISYRNNVVLTGDALATYGIATISGALTMGMMAGHAVNRFLAGSRYALPEYHTQWRKMKKLEFIEKMKLIQPLIARIDSRRVDRIIKALRGSGSQWSAGSNLIWRIPAVIWRIIA
jgi:flavin-dependent dehydrogenase